MPIFYSLHFWLSYEVQVREPQVVTLDEHPKGKRVPAGLAAEDKRGYPWIRRESEIETSWHEKFRAYEENTTAIDSKEGRSQEPVLRYPL